MTLWAISCYFNPARRRSRLRNYRIFRSRLTVPLLTVELVLHGVPELTAEDADVLHQIQGGEQHILWQKERLLNLAMERLPADCSAVAWLDSDIVFANPLWPEQAMALLARHQLIQLFDRVVYLPQEASLAPCLEPFLLEAERYYWQPGAVSNQLAEQPVTFLKVNQRGFGSMGNPGMAWAAQRSFLKRHGLYDRAIIGSGDMLFYAAIFDRRNKVDRQLKDGTAWRCDYDRWARALRAELCTLPSYLSGTIFHCWHGELVDRAYTQRHRAIAPFGFDPSADLKLDGNGCWCWSSDKPQLHACLRDYFDSRLEDGPSQQPGARG